MFYVLVIEESLVIKVVGEPVLKLNTGILKCQIPSSMKHQVQIVSWKFGNNFIYSTKTWPKGNWSGNNLFFILLLGDLTSKYKNCFNFPDLDLIMVPSGELHITSVDYKHTHHPYFCIVKHLQTGNSQESLPFHLTLKGKNPVPNYSQHNRSFFTLKLWSNHSPAVSSILWRQKLSFNVFLLVKLYFHWVCCGWRQV